MLATRQGTIRAWEGREELAARRSSECTKKYDFTVAGEGFGRVFVDFPRGSLMSKRARRAAPAQRRALPPPRRSTTCPCVAGAHSRANPTPPAARGGGPAEASGERGAVLCLQAANVGGRSYRLGSWHACGVRQARGARGARGDRQGTQRTHAGHQKNENPIRAAHDPCVQGGGREGDKVAFVLEAIRLSLTGQ